MSKPMFSWREAILKSDLPPTTRHVLLTLACHMTDAGDKCFPSIKLLCDETGLSNRAVITHLQSARELGWITVKQRVLEGQRWAAHQYFPAWPHYLREVAESFEKAMNEVHSLRKEAVKEVHKDSKKAVNLKQEGSEPRSKGGEPDTEKAVKEVHTSTSESTSMSTSESTSHTPSEAGSCCKRMRVQGIDQCNPLHPTLLALIDAGATREEFEEAAKIAVSKGKSNFAYAIGIVKRQREDAAKLTLHKGRMPDKHELLDQEKKDSTERAKARLFGTPTTEKDISHETTRL